MNLNMLLNLKRRNFKFHFRFKLCKLDKFESEKSPFSIGLQNWRFPGNLRTYLCTGRN